MSILVIGTKISSVPNLSTPAVPVAGLADPDRSLRTAIPALAPTSDGAAMMAAAVLIDSTGAIVKVVPNVRSVQDFKDDVKRLW